MTDDVRAHGAGGRLTRVARVPTAIHLIAPFILFLLLSPRVTGAAASAQESDFRTTTVSARGKATFAHLKYAPALMARETSIVDTNSSLPKVRAMDGDTILTKMVGRWKGICRTWFEPEKLADESELEGEFTGVLGGRFVRHDYRGTIQGKPRRGEELIAFNAVTQSYQTSWVDDFHMNYAIMFSQGKPSERGFSVFGEYDVGEGQPRWGWRTEYRLIADDQITITAYNVTPEGLEAKAVEVTYRRLP